jgi:diacylglycerol kinase (ATP)
VDAIAVYGGDGTVLEVASTLAGSAIPLVLLPGGTANVLSVELGIPQDLAQAALLLGGVPNAIRAVDMGALGDVDSGDADNGAMLFFHLGIGAEGRLHEIADRDAKDRSGMFAYVTAALKTVTNPPQAHYQLTLDGTVVEADGIDLMITTYGSVGVAGLKVSHAIDVGDGLLDVVLIEDTSVPSLLAAAATAVTARELAGPMRHWQAHEVTVVTDPPQPVAVDGELLDVERVTVRVVSQALKVVVPAPSS